MKLLEGNTYPVVHAQPGRSKFQRDLPAWISAVLFSCLFAVSALSGLSASGDGSGGASPAPGPGSLVRDGFAYPTGALNGRNGGVGFSTPWSGSANFLVVSGSLSGGGTADSNLQAGEGTITRRLTENIGTPGTVRYLSFYERYGFSPLMPPQPSGRCGVMLQGTSGPGLFVGKSDTGSFVNWILENAAGGSQVVGPLWFVGFTATTRLVVKCEFFAGNDRFTLFVNPAPGQPEPTTGTVKFDSDVGTLTNMAFRATGLDPMSSWGFDELRLASTYEGALALCPAIAIRPSALHDAGPNVPYFRVLQASGGTAPHTFALANGVLPSGLTLTSGGLLSGTPDVVGQYSFGVVVTDAAGCSSSVSYTLDVTTNPFTLTTEPMTTGEGLRTATLLPNGKVLMVGGLDEFSPALSAELFDPATGLWTPAADMSARRYNHTATLLPNGKVLVVGGEGPSIESSVELYDPETGLWSLTGSMADIRYYHTAVLLQNGKVLVTGGRDGTFHGTGSTELYDPDLGTWSSTGSMAVHREGHTATLLPSGKVLVVGGYIDTIGGSTSTAEIYDPVNGQWTSTGSTSTWRSGHTATLLANGRVLVCGGYNSVWLDSAELYNPITGLWEPANAMGTPRQDARATLLPNGNVMVSGGYNQASGYLTSVEVYNAVGGTWSTAGDLNIARWRHTSTLLPGGKVLFSGGGNATSYHKSAELLDFPLGTWTAGGLMGQERNAHTMTLLPDERVLVAGGGAALAEIFDPGNGSWDPTGALTDERNGHTATLLPNGTVLAVGGQRPSDGNFLASSELFHPSSGTWTLGNPIHEKRATATATLLGNGKVLLAGGFNDVVPFVLSSAEIFDTTDGLWTVTAPMATGRYSHTATLLPNGQVLVAGGLSTGGVTNSAELYNPVSGVWSPTGPLIMSRVHHTMTLLPNGTVLVAGGYDTTGNSIARAEIYDPSTGTWTETTPMKDRRGGHMALLLPNGKVLVAGGSSNGGSIELTTSEIYEPITGAWTDADAMDTARVYARAVLLANGKVLAAGGYDGAARTRSAELFDPRWAFDPAWQPQIGSLNATLGLEANLTVSGTLFRGVSGGSTGSYQDSPGDYPLVQLRSLENGQTLYLPSTHWSSTEVTSAPVQGLHPGWTMVTLVVNGIPSASRIIRLEAKSEVLPIVLTGAVRLPDGTFQFTFANTPGQAFTALASEDAALPLASWTVLGPVTEVSPGQYLFSDSPPAQDGRRFYGVRSP